MSLLYSLFSIPYTLNSTLNFFTQRKQHDGHGRDNEAVLRRALLVKEATPVKMEEEPHDGRDKHDSEDREGA